MTRNTLQQNEEIVYRLGVRVSKLTGECKKTEYKLIYDEFYTYNEGLKINKELQLLRKELEIYTEILKI